MELLMKIAFFLALGAFLFGWLLLILDEEVEHKRKKKDKATKGR